MEKSIKLSWLYEFLLHFEAIYEFEHEKRPKGGAKKTFTHSSFLLFFITMFLKGIFAFKAMTHYGKDHYREFGFRRAPSRRTIKRRFKQLPKVVAWLMPCIAKYAYERLCHKVFNLKWQFADKSIFRAKGGLWHKKHKDAGIVPHSSIDTDASWAKSPYHKWRFGYGLLIIANESRFPTAVFANTASFHEPKQALQLAKVFKDFTTILVGDAAYRVWTVIQQCWAELNLMILTKWKNIRAKNTFQQEYKGLIETAAAYHLYSRRKPSVEPCFSLIKELFHLKGESQLPYKGLAYVTAFLVTITIAVQLMMIFNFCHQQKIGSFKLFLTLFR